MTAVVVRLGAVATLALAGCGGQLATPHVFPAQPTTAFPTTWDGRVTAAVAAKAAEVASQKAQATDQAAFDKAAKDDSVDAYLAYYAAPGASVENRVEALRRAAKKADAIADTSGRDAAYEKLLGAAPQLVPALLPVERRVLYVGPPGARVKDVLAMRQRGLGDEVIASKISSGEHAYKSFTLEELAALKSLGVPDTITKAMIDATANADRAGKEKQEREALKAEIATLRKMVETHGGASAGGAAPTAGGKVVQTKDGPLNLAACLAAKLVAKQACEQIPWPGSTVCASGVASAYPCE